MLPFLQMPRMKKINSIVDNLKHRLLFPIREVLFYDLQF